MILSLSRRVQRLAQQRLVALSFTNAMGFGLITGQTIYLVALMYGASDTQMGLLYAAPFVTTLASVFVPALLNKHETTAIWSRFWWLRSIFCIGYFALPWMLFSNARVWIFVLLYYLFMTTRAFGMAGYFTVFRAISPPRENASLMARTLLSGQVGVLLAQIIAFAVLTSNAAGTEQRNLFALLTLGALFNFITAFLIGKLPQTGYLMGGSMRGLARTAGEILRQQPYREVALVTAFQSAMMVFAGYLISYLRNVGGFSSSEIFLFTLVSVFGSMAMSNLLRQTGHRIQARVILFASHAALLVMSLAWALMRLLPGCETSRAFVCILYSLSAFCLTAATTVNLQLRTGRLPTHRSVEHSIIYDMAQVAGAVAAIGLARLALIPVFSPAYVLHPYSLTFLLWALTCALVCLLTTRMQSTRGGGLLEELGVLLPSSIFTIIRAHRLDQDDNFIRRQLAMEGLLQSPNPASRELILEHLRSPDVGIRGSCIRVLMGYPLDEALPALLDEAASPFSPLRSEAVTAIGFSGKPDILPALWTVWETASPDIRAALVKSMLRLGETLPDDRIAEVWNACPSLKRTDILIGLAVTQRTRLLLELLGEELALRPDPYRSRMLYGITAASAGLRESMFEVFTEEDRRPGSGLDAITANIETPWPPVPTQDACRQLIEAGDYAGLTARLRAILDQPWVVAYDRSTALGTLFILLLTLGDDFTASLSNRTHPPRAQSDQAPRPA